MAAGQATPGTRLPEGRRYSNDFETNADGFDVTQTEVLPSDEVGGTATDLGSRSPVSQSAALTLTGLTTGAVCLPAGLRSLPRRPWDGSLSFGPDVFTPTSSSSGTLVNATFGNGFPMGDPMPGQTCSKRHRSATGACSRRARERT